MNYEEMAILKLELQLKLRGYSTTQMLRNSPLGDLHAKKDSQMYVLRLEG